MKKILITLIITLVMAVTVLCGCEKQTSNTTKQTTKAAETTTKEEITTTEGSTYATYTIAVYDIDGEKLGEKTLSTEQYPTVLSALSEEFTLVASTTDYGTSITSINGSVVDKNWYLTIYENDEYSMVGVDGLVIDDGDKFDFVSKCWNTVESGYGTMDETDVLVDVAIYHYAKTYMKQLIAADTTFAGSNFWTYMAIGMMRDNLYDTNVFTVGDSNTALTESITNADFSAFQATDWGKYYYTSKALGSLNNAFITAYEAHINEIANEFPAYGEYSIPFEISPAKTLEITSTNLEAIISTDYMASTEYGVDGLAWQVACLQLWDTYSKDVLVNFPLQDQGNATSTAIELLVYAAFNESPRTEEADLVKTLMDTYYDADLQLVKYLTTDEGVNYSTNQIYAALMAYKVSRDTKGAVNLFA